MKPPIHGKQLSKEDFLNGRHDEMILQAGLADVMKRTPVEVRIARRDEMLQNSPPGQMVWVFGYGSLIWNPAFEFDEIRTGILYGYHRLFCFWSKIGRGTPEEPGMMLALDRGGCCKGIVLGVKRERAQDELTSVFMRELVGETYHPKWGQVRTDKGTVSAITFVANREAEQYAGRRPLEEIAHYIAQGSGHLGPCKDYLFNTTQHLEDLGLHDPMMRELCNLVERKLSLNDS
ncbi:MAG: hypothetical protein CFH41_00952 [Alphaproteobacteria bacterium MarineAlpha11_Bin1]|nr:MAG: hypothetical protein CFH41_00952 [Alphaproteobacteria bacterium MarineAlpha11_Bin1]|tara:strand:+ start:9425 stop:10123 length:699 start_codon:yes stop_codon:yes gene_type:complete